MLISYSLRVLFCFVLLAAFGTSLRAQSTIPNCAEDPTCYSLSEQAAAQLDTKNLDEALRFYRGAYEIKADPNLLFNIARVLHKQGKTADAVSYYQKFLASPSPSTATRRRVQEYLKELETVNSPQAARPVAGTKPVYKKWWFWTILGTVTAAGIAGAVTGVVIASQPSRFTFTPISP